MFSRILLVALFSAGLGLMSLDVILSLGAALMYAALVSVEGME